LELTRVQKKGHFTEAMDALSKQPSRRHVHQGEGCSIVLPIDNIDRSTDHLEAIIKLAQMVSHPCLWLAMVHPFLCAPRQAANTP
jgi:hypothetical protein